MEDINPLSKETSKVLHIQPEYNKKDSDRNDYVPCAFSLLPEYSCMPRYNNVGFEELHINAAKQELT
ncbi:hypothetical protein HZS_6494 [Henneguya salminicola]|nr:hypothetical protein HZS_6494 [Henneguya salminicola]